MGKTVEAEPPEERHNPEAVLVPGEGHTLQPGDTGLVLAVVVHKEQVGLGKVPADPGKVPVKGELVKGSRPLLVVPVLAVELGLVEPAFLMVVVELEAWASYRSSSYIQ